MRSFRDLSIKRKLRLIIMTNVGAALVLASTAYFSYDLVALRKETKSDLSILAQIIGSNSTAALSFNDANSAQEILKRSEEHTSELQSPCNLVCRLLLEKKNHPAGPRPPLPGGPRASRSRPRALVYTVHPLRGSPVFFFFNDTATTEIYTLSLHDALPISCRIT